MIAFERHLIENGYKQFDIDFNRLVFIKPVRSYPSTMSCIHLHWFHEDSEAFKLIGLGAPISEVRAKGEEIITGLNEAKHPPTIVYPRPKIELKRSVNGVIKVLDEVWDDAMNVCIQRESSEDIMKAMFDRSIVFKYDETDYPHYIINNEPTKKT